MPREKAGDWLRLQTEPCSSDDSKCNFRALAKEAGKCTGELGSLPWAYASVKRGTREKKRLRSHGRPAHD